MKLPQRLSAANGQEPTARAAGAQRTRQIVASGLSPEPHLVYQVVRSGICAMAEKKRLLATVLTFALLFADAATGRSRMASQSALTRSEFVQAHMGTQFRIVLYARDAETAARASAAAFERIARLDATMSDYRETS